MRPQQVTGIRPSRGKADPRSAGSRQRGVLLINLGTPEGPDPASVRAYLAEFLSDPEVIHLPAPLRCFNRPLGHLIARFRAPKSAAMYQRIWSKCGSPLRSITEEQASKLATMLPDHWKVFYAMRYGRPSIGETLEEIEAAGIEELIVIPMYPQYSGSTTGTALHELYGRLRRSHYLIHVIARTTWYDDGGYVYAQAYSAYSRGYLSGIFRPWAAGVLRRARGSVSSASASDHFAGHQPPRLAERASVPGVPESPRSRGVA